MQRQLRLGDILDDYCPRERRLTNHAIVAMIGEEVKQTRCSTCDAEHEYKHARVPRQRRKDSPAGLQAQILASGPKRVSPEPIRGAASSTETVAAAAAPAGRHEVSPPPAIERNEDDDIARVAAALGLGSRIGSRAAARAHDDMDGTHEGDDREPELGGELQEDDGGQPGQPEGPAHRRLIRATLPRLEGQQPAARPAPDFTIRTPNTGRPNRFKPRQNQRGAQPSAAGQRPGHGGHPGRPSGPRQGDAAGNRQAPGGRPRRFDNRNNKRSK